MTSSESRPSRLPQVTGPIQMLHQGLRELRPKLVDQAIRLGADLGRVHQDLEGEMFEPPLVAVCAATDLTAPPTDSQHRRRAAIVNRLIAAGAPIETPDGEGYTPLAWCAIHNRWDLVVRLIAAGADPYAPDPEQATVLGNALQDHQADGTVLLDRLLAAGIDPARDPHMSLGEVLGPPCHWSDDARAHALTRLIDAGLSLDAGEGNPPWLRQAVESGLVACVDRLLNHGVPATVQADAMKGFDSHLIPAGHPDHPAELTHVALDDQGWTLLHLAAYDGYAAVVRRLIQHGLDATQPSQGGITPLHALVLGSHRDDADREIADLLIDAGARVDVTSPQLYGHTPLSLAMAHPNGHGSLLPMEAVVLRETLPPTSPEALRSPRPRL